MLVTKQVQTELINICYTKTPTMMTSARKNTMETKSKSTMWTAWTSRLEREPRCAHVLSLNEELIRACYTQTEKATLLRKTEKQLRPGQQKFQVKQKQPHRLYSLWLQNTGRVYLCVQIMTPVVALAYFKQMPLNFMHVKCEAYSNEINTHEQNGCHTLQSSVI